MAIHKIEPDENTLHGFFSGDLPPVLTIDSGVAVHHSQTCTICHKSVTPFARYPNYLCLECASRAKSKDGRCLKFSNIDTTGGFIAEYAETG